MEQWQPRRGHSRRYRFRSSRRRLQWRWALIALAGLAVLLFGLVKLIGYGLDLISSRHTSDKLQTIYYADPTGEPMTPAQERAASPAPDAALPEISFTSPFSASAQSPSLYSPSVDNPDNSEPTVNSRFTALRNESQYIVGWLSIHNMLDEAVVQQDNVYYLDHDAVGNSNVNGALFLDSAIELKKQPYTYIIYGHNMKSGAMFGSLWNYENSSVYHNDPFITFDTIYETGRYVIFGAGVVSTEEDGRNYVDFYVLRSAKGTQRQAAIDDLINASVHTCPIDVQADDQLLVLVTCVDKDEDRRVVVARRIREGEDEAALQKLVERSWKR